MGRYDPSSTSTPTLALRALNHDCFHLSKQNEDQIGTSEKDVTKGPGGLKERLHQELGGHAEKEERAPVMTFHQGQSRFQDGLFEKDNISFGWSQKALEMDVGVCFCFYLFTSVSLTIHASW